MLRRKPIFIVADYARPNCAEQIELNGGIKTTVPKSGLVDSVLLGVFLSVTISAPSISIPNNEMDQPRYRE